MPSIQKFKTVTENKKNLDFLFEFRAIFSFCSADILFFTPHLSLETFETIAQPVNSMWITGTITAKQKVRGKLTEFTELNQHITFYLFNGRKVNSLAPKQLRNFVSATYSFWKNPTLMATPQQPEFWLQPIIGPRLWI